MSDDRLDTEFRLAIIGLGQAGKTGSPEVKQSELEAAHRRLYLAHEECLRAARVAMRLRDVGLLRIHATANRIGIADWLEAQRVVDGEERGKYEDGPPSAGVPEVVGAFRTPEGLS